MARLALARHDEARQDGAWRDNARQGHYVVADLKTSQAQERAATAIVHISQSGTSSLRHTNHGESRNTLLVQWANREA